MCLDTGNTFNEHDRWQQVSEKTTGGPKAVSPRNLPSTVQDWIKLFQKSVQQACKQISPDSVEETHAC